MERAQNKCERIVLEALYNVVETVLEDRVPLSPRDSYTKTKPPFNLDHPMNDAVRSEMSLWKHNVYSPLVLDVFHLQPGGHGAAPAQVLLERWQALFIPTRPEGSNSRDVTSQLRAAYRHVSVFLRTLFCMLRILPATKIARACRRAVEHAPTKEAPIGAAGRVQYAVYSQPSSLEQQLAPGTASASHYAAASAASTPFKLQWDCTSYRFCEIPTPFGVLHVSVQYRRDVTSQMPHGGGGPSASAAHATPSGGKFDGTPQHQQQRQQAGVGWSGGRDARQQPYPVHMRPHQQQQSAYPYTPPQQFTGTMAPRSMPDRLGMYPRGQSQSTPSHHHQHPQQRPYGARGTRGPGTWGGGDGSTSGSSGTNSSMSSGRGGAGGGGSSSGSVPFGAKRSPSYEKALSQAGGGSWQQQHHHRRHTDAPLPNRGSLSSAMSGQQSDSPHARSGGGAEFVPHMRQRSRTLSDAHESPGGGGLQQQRLPQQQHGGPHQPGSWSAPVPIHRSRPRPSSGSRDGADLFDGDTAEAVGIPRSVSNEQLNTYGSLPTRFPPARHVTTQPTYGTGHNHGGGAAAYGGPDGHGGGHGGHWGGPGGGGGGAGYRSSSRGMDIPMDNAALRRRQRSGLVRRDRDSFDSIMGSMSPHSGSAHSSTFMGGGGGGVDDGMSDDSGGGSRRHSSAANIDVTGRYASHHRRGSSGGGGGSYDQSAPIHIRETPPRYPSQSGSLSGSGRAPRNSMERGQMAHSHRSTGTPPAAEYGGMMTFGGGSHGSSHGSTGGGMMMMHGGSSLDNTSSGSYDNRRRWSDGGGGGSGSLNSNNPFGKSPRGPSPVMPGGGSSGGGGSAGMGGSNDSIFGISRMEALPEHGRQDGNMVSALWPSPGLGRALPTVPDDDESQLGGSSMGYPLVDDDDDAADDRTASPMLPFAFDDDAASSPQVHHQEQWRQQQQGQQPAHHQGHHQPQLQGRQQQQGVRKAGPVEFVQRGTAGAAQLLQQCASLHRHLPTAYADILGPGDERGFTLDRMRDLVRQLN